MKPKLVVLSAFFSPFRSGAEAMVEEVFPRLADKFEITVVTCRMNKSLSKKEKLNGLDVIRVGFGFSFDKYLFPFLAPLKTRSLKPSIIHAVLESYAGAALVVCRFLMPKTKRILTLQSTNSSLFLGPIHRSANVLTAISRALIERAKIYTNNQAALIPNGIDFASIRDACKKYHKIPGRVLFVGRLEQMKGVDVLISAFAMVVSGSPQSHLRIVGDGSLRSELEAKTKALNISDRVAFTGRLTGAELFEEYAAAEIFCGLSRSEALGNVFLEAQASGSAVLTTRVGGIMDIVENGRTGLLVLPDDVAGAAGALHRLLTDGELREALASKALEGKEKYDWGKIAWEYEKVLKNV